jgi:dihydroneopterin aldolase
LSRPFRLNAPEKRPLTALGFLFDGIDEVERRARLRELRVLVAVYCGWDHPAKAALDQAISSNASYEIALEAIDQLPALRRRRLLATYAAL